MAIYRFVLEQFHIGKTRALHNDTDAVNFTVKVGSQEPLSQNKYMGDVNDGDYPVDLRIEPVSIDDPNTPVVFNYQILNSGHKNDAEIDQLLTGGANALAAGAAGLGGIWGAAAGWAIKYFAGIWTADCDGPVAIDQVSTNGAALDAWTAAAGFHRETRYYPGTESASGCGGNSQYTVTWSVYRMGPTEVGLDILVHVEGVGDETFHANELAGTSGQSRRLEGFQIVVNPPIPGLSMQYMAHLQGIGDTPWVNEGQFVGTRGQERRLEGFAIRLTGPAAGAFDIEYRAHVQNIGDTPFVSNGAFCGTRGQSLRVEAMQVRINRK